MKNEEIGALLKNLRLKHQLTQAEVAEKVYVTPQAVSRWEKGINTPNLVTLVELKKLYHVSIDELLLEVESKVDPVPPDKEHHWTLRYVLYPFLLIFLAIGLSQFYFFLNTRYAIVIMGIFFGGVLSALMLVLKVRKKGPLFLITLGALLLVNGTVYLANKRYFDLAEVPYLIEKDTFASGVYVPNALPIGLRSEREGTSMLLRYVSGSSAFHVYDLSAPLDRMMTTVTTARPVMDVAIVNGIAYLSCYEQDASTSDIYAYDLLHRALNLVHQGERIYRLTASDTSLYLLEPFDPQIDNHDVIYRFNGSDVLVAEEFPFEIYDIVYNHGYDKFFVSTVQSSIDPTKMTNIGIYDESFDRQAWVFAERGQEQYELKADGLKVYSAIDSRLIVIQWTTITYTDVFAQVDMIHNSGLATILHGSKIDENYEVETEVVIRDRRFRDVGGFEFYYVESTNRYVGFAEDAILELRPYSRQIETIELAPSVRLPWFFASMPFLALVVTLGAKQTFQRKKTRLDKTEQPVSSS